MDDFYRKNKKDAADYNHSVNKILLEICGPLFSNFGIKTFRYGRFYKDGKKYFLLSTREDWFRYLIDHCEDNGRVLQQAVRQAPLEEFYYFPWPFDNTDPVLSSFYQHDIFHGLSLYKRHEEYVEFWCFAAGKEDHLISNFYINGKEVLKKFSFYFNEKVADFINASDTRGLIHRKANVEMSLLENPFTVHKMQAFLQKIEPEKHSIFAHGREVPLTRRESECLIHLTLGKTVKEVARSMHLSPRTVETYVNNIKQKTHFRRKLDLVRLFVESH